MLPPSPPDGERPRQEPGSAASWATPTTTLGAAQDAAGATAADTSESRTAVRGDETLGPRFWLAVGFVVFMILLAILAPWLPIRDPAARDFEAISQTPNLDYWLGTDGLGRDLLARVIWGARISLAIGVFAVAIGMAVGGFLGLVAGYFRGALEKIIMALSDAMLAFPPLVLLLAVAVIFRTTMFTLAVALGVLSVPTFARLSRANTLRFAEREFVLAGQAIGAKHGRLLFRHILPNVALPVAAYAFLIIAVVIVAEGSLSFLGLGVSSPSVSWGGMIGDGRADLRMSPHISLIPSIAMFLAVFAFNVIGDRLRMRFDVRDKAL